MPFPWWLSQERAHLQMQEMQKRGFNPWVRKSLWRRKWQLAPVFLPGKCYSQRRLAGYSPWVTKDQTCLSIRTYTHTHTLMKKMYTVNIQMALNQHELGAIYYHCTAYTYSYYTVLLHIGLYIITQILYIVYYLVKSLLFIKTKSHRHLFTILMWLCYIQKK